MITKDLMQMSAAQLVMLAQDNHMRIEGLEAALRNARDWFESQAKATSKGCPSSWELMELRDKRDEMDEALR